MATKNASYKKIFISYRVQDTAGETGRLVDALKQHFADNQLFMDIENLEPGADFTQAIEGSLDTCDVFLAVIGPHWIGDRDGNEPRINNPNDWVRLEVSTALKRNIRVVPVLVDGGTLPKPEQLPDELQPLLRRQSIEISNKRWRYDTDQLINFLINTAGIQPLKAAASQPVALPEKKKRTWVYVGAGFALALVVLIIIGSLLPNEKKSPGNSDSKNEQSAMQQNASSNPAATADENKTNPQTNTTTESNSAGNVASVAGQWDEVDVGETSTFVLTQNGNRLAVQVQLNGQLLSTGNGEINGRDVELNFLLLGLPTVLKARLSDDGNTMKGSYTIQANGSTEPVQLTRRAN